MTTILLFLSLMEITPKMINHLLHLARLESVPEKEHMLIADLEKMVGFIEQLNEINTDGVMPLQYMAETKQALRTDEATAPIDPHIILANAPVPDSTYFKVPTVIKK